MSFKSVLQTIGGDAKKVFAFLGSPKGQAIAQVGEGVAEAVDPALTGVFDLLNNWAVEIFKTESIAAAAGQQNGSGTQKAAAVASAIESQFVAYLQTQGIVSAPTAAEIKTANDYLVGFLNTIAGKGSSAAPGPGGVIPSPVGQ